jgi:hypothetical protein
MKNLRLLIIAVAAVLLLIVALFASISGYFSFSLSLPKSEVSKKIESLYELANPGTNVEVLSLNEESGLYKALLKVVSPTGTNYAEIYVTKDGKLLAQNVILVEQLIEQMKKLKDFVDCLDSKKLKIYGVLNQTENPQGATATLLQLNILGVYSSKLYVSCDGRFVQNCISTGVTQVPSVVFGGRIEPGVKTIEWFESATGCKF